MGFGQHFGVIQGQVVDDDTIGDGSRRGVGETGEVGEVGFERRGCVESESSAFFREPEVIEGETVEFQAFESGWIPGGEFASAIVQDSGTLRATTYFRIWRVDVEIVTLDKNRHVAVGVNDDSVLLVDIGSVRERAKAFVAVKECAIPVKYASGSEADFRERGFQKRVAARRGQRGVVGVGSKRRERHDFDFGSLGHFRHGKVPF